MVVGGKAVPVLYSCSAAECQRLTLFGRAVSLGGARWVTPTVAATIRVPYLMQGHVLLSQERRGDLQSSSEGQEEH